MKTIRKISQDIYYLGVSDRRLALFENLFPLDNGVSYNSYFIDDEKTALTVCQGCFFTGFSRTF